MNYCIVNEKNIISNMIVCENDDVAKQLGATSSYPGAKIGDEYDPYNYQAVTELKSQVADLNLLVNTLTGVE